MQDAIQISLYHCLLTDQRPYHSRCPKGLSIQTTELVKIINNCLMYNLHNFPLKYEDMCASAKFFVHEVLGKHVVCLGRFVQVRLV